MDQDNLFIKLRQYVKGKISSGELASSDDLIYSIREHKDMRGQSQIFLDIPVDDFMEKILTDDNDIWFFRSIKSGSHNFIDYHLATDDFDEGFGPWNYFSEDNDSLADKIGKLLIGPNFEISNEDMRKELAKKLYDNFQKQYDNIVYSYTNEKDSEMSQSAEDVINKDLEELEKEIGFKVSTRSVSTTVANLFSNLVKYNLYTSTIMGLLETISNDYEVRIGGWEEDMWNYQNDKYFDKASYNREVDWNLDQVYDKLTEDFGEESLKAHRDLVDRITRKFRMDTLYQVPKSSKYFFSIRNFDIADNKIMVFIKNKTGQNKTIGMTEENFYHFLYQPELFELEI
jgi:hypothetical protein